MSSIKKNYTYNLIYRIFTILTPIITTPYVSRVLGASGIGEYSYYLSIVTYFGIFGILGFNIYAQLEISKTRNDTEKCTKVTSEIIVIRTITLLLSIIIYFTLIMINNGNTLMMSILIIYLLSQLIDFSWILQGLENFKRLVFRNMIVKIISIILIFALVKKPSDIYIYALIMQGSVFLGNLVIYKYIKNYINFKYVEKSELKRHLKNSLIFCIPTIASSIYTVLDKSMIGWFTHSSIQNGFYEQSHKIEQILVTVVTSISTVTLPRMAYLNSTNDKEKYNSIMNKTILFVLIISLPMSLGLIAVSNNLIPLFLGEEYKDCVLLVQIFSLLIIICGLSHVIGNQSLMATGKQKEYNTCIIIGTMLNFVLNIILIPKQGALGAAFSSVVAELIILLLFYKYGRKNLHLSIKKNLINYIIAVSIMFIIILTIKDVFKSLLMNLILQVVSGAIIYFFVLFILKDTFFNEIMELLIKKIKQLRR